MKRYKNIFILFVLLTFYTFFNVITVSANENKLPEPKKQECCESGDICSEDELEKKGNANVIENKGNETNNNSHLENSEEILVENIMVDCEENENNTITNEEKIGNNDSIKEVSQDAAGSYIDEDFESVSDKSETIIEENTEETEKKEEGSVVQSEENNIITEGNNEDLFGELDKKTNEEQDNKNDEETENTVTVNYGDEITPEKVFTIKTGECISSDIFSDIQERKGYIFDGWYEESDNDELNKKYDFSQPIIKNTNISARWEKIDYDISWYNEDAEEYIIVSSQQLWGLTLLVKGLTFEYDSPLDFKEKSISIDRHISLSDELWMPIGTEKAPFSGIFEGNGKTINRFYTNNFYDYNGLFGYVSGTVKDLYITYADIYGEQYSGILSGYISPDGIAENVTVMGTVHSGIYGGGVAGCTAGKIISSVNNANITSSEFAGGITGLAEEKSYIEECVNFKSDIIASATTVNSTNFAGGIAGQCKGEIIGCINNGKVSALVSAGGIAGNIQNASTAKSLNTGCIETQFGLSGGISGNAKNSYILYCGNLGVLFNQEGVSGGIAANAEETTINSCYSMSEYNEKIYSITCEDKGNTVINCYYLQKTDEENIINTEETLSEKNEEASDIQEENTSDEEQKSEFIIFSASEEQFTSGEVAWLLNTAGGTLENEAVWGNNGSYPIIADAENKPIFKVSVSFDDSKGSLVSVPEYACEGRKISIKVAAELGYEIDGVWIEGASTNKEQDLETVPYYFYMPAEDITAYVLFNNICSDKNDEENDDKDDNDKDDKVVVVFDSCGGVFYRDTEKECEVVSKKVIAGRRVTPPENPEKNQCVFDGWFYDTEGKNKFDFNAKITEDITLFAVYHSVRKYTVTFDVNGGAGKAPEAYEAESGSLITYPGDIIWIDSSKSFNGWSSIKDDTTAKWDFKKDKMPEKDITLYALWLENDTDFKGSGIQSSPYLIDSEEDMYRLFEKVTGGNSYKGRYFKLNTSDVIFNKSIGNESNPFSGYFDGDNNSIELNIDSNLDYQGLFGYINNGNILNLTVTGKVTGKSYVGGIAGYIKDGKISNCSNEADIIASDSYAGGIVGSGSVNNSHNRGSITGIQYVGGIAGESTGDLSGCENYGTVTAKNGYIGGIAGSAKGKTAVSCINRGEVKLTGNENGGDEKAYTGGIAGIIATVESCENFGTINGFARTGGIAGRITCNAAYCTNTGFVIGTVRAGGIAGSVSPDSIIKFCSNNADIKSLVSYAGGIAGDCENNSVIEYSSCTAPNIVSNGSYVGGIAGKGGYIRNSFYYNKENTNFGIGDNSTVTASYYLVDNNRSDNDFINPEKSQAAFSNGMVSWLMNTDGGGLFEIENHDKSNSEKWSVDNGIPVYARGNAIFAIIVEQNDETSEFGKAFVDGKQYVFGKKGERHNISYTVSKSGIFQEVNAYDFWTAALIDSINPDSEKDNMDLRIDNDIRIVGSFTENPIKEPDEEKDNEEKGDEEKVDEEKEPTEEKKHSSSSSGAKYENKNSGYKESSTSETESKNNEDTGSGINSGNGTGASAGSGEGEGTGTGNGSGSGTGIGSSSSSGGGTGSGSSGTAETSTEKSSKATEVVRTQKSDTSEEVITQSVQNNGSNVLSEEVNSSNTAMQLSANYHSDMKSEDIGKADTKPESKYEESGKDFEEASADGIAGNPAKSVSKFVEIQKKELNEKTSDAYDDFTALYIMLFSFVFGLGGSLFMKKKIV